MTFLEIVEDHNEDVQRLQERKDTAIAYRHFGTGFVLVNTSPTGEDYITSFAVDDVYPRAMWRFIRSLLIRRPRPIVIQYLRNFDKLFKASQRYGAIALDDGIVVFPTTKD